MGSPERIPGMPRPTPVSRSVPSTSGERETADSLVQSFSIVEGGPVSFALVDTMRVLPVSKRLVMQLLAQASLPLVPLIVMGTPTPELVHDVLKMLL